MKSTDKPSLIETVIASGAKASYVRTIPKTQTKSGSGEMSLALGWPPECAIPVAAGGKYPQMSDANGVLNLLSAAVQQLQARFLGPYNAEFATAIGGYPLNAIVSDTTAGKFWVSTAEDNTTVPGAAGADWQDLFAKCVLQGQNLLATDTPAAAAWLDLTTDPGYPRLGISGGNGQTYGFYGVAKINALLSTYLSNTNPGIQGALTGTSLCVNPSDGRSYLAYSGNTKIDALAWYADVVSEATARANADSNLQNQINGKQPAGNYVATNNPNTRFYCWNAQAASGDTIYFPVPFTDVNSIVLSLTAQDTSRGAWLTYDNLTTTSFTVVGRYMSHGNLDHMPQTQVSVMVYGW